MITIIKIIKESIIQAFQQLSGSKLRSFLSLLGITIGIFCIIIVLSAVDSLESNVRSSFDKLGDDVIYVDKQPWDEDPGLKTGHRSADWLIWFHSFRGSHFQVGSFISCFGLENHYNDLEIVAQVIILIVLFFCFSTKLCPHHIIG